MKKRLVIVGGGFAGITLTKKLYKKFDITLIDKNDYQTFYPALFKVISTSAEISKIFSAVAIKFKEIFINKEVKILKEEIVKILSDKNQIAMKQGGVHKKLEYDYLVLAVGSQPKTNGLTFNNFADALEIKEAIENVFKHKAKKDKINISIVGGGVTGCELTGVLVDYVEELSKKYGHPSELIQIKLFEKHKEILHSASVWMRKKVEKTLGEEGVEILLSREEKFVKGDVVIWTIGVESVNFIGIEKHKNIFVVESKTAQSAIHQARFVAKKLGAILKKKKVARYKPNKNFYIIGLGKKYTFADFGFIKLKSWRAHLLRQTAFLQYFMSISSFWFEAFKRLKKLRGL